MLSIRQSRLKLSLLCRLFSFRYLPWSKRSLDGAASSSPFDFPTSSAHKLLVSQCKIDCLRFHPSSSSHSPMEFSVTPSRANTSIPRIEFSAQPRAPKDGQEEHTRILAHRSHQDLKVPGYPHSSIAQRVPEEKELQRPSLAPSVDGDGLHCLSIRDGEIPRVTSPRFSLPKSPIATENAQLAQFSPKYKPRALSPLKVTERSAPSTPSNTATPTTQLQSPESEEIAPTILIGIDFGTT